MAEHVPAQVGAYDRDGRRTFQTPGDVCLGCSDPDQGLWVPVSACAEARANLDALERWLDDEGPKPWWLRDLGAEDVQDD